MSESPKINVTQLIQPLVLSAVLKGQDIGPIIDALINVQVNDIILNQVLSSMQIPEDFKPIVDVLRLAANLDTLKAVMAAAKGETYEPKFGIDKVIEVVVSLQMVGALSQALGGGTGGGSSGGGSSGGGAGGA